MEEIQRKHRQEQKDLQSRIMQKKKSATKKTRKGVNDECTNLERQLKEQQELELSALDSSLEPETSTPESKRGGESQEFISNCDEHAFRVGDLDGSLKTLHVSGAAETPDQAKKPNRQKARLARRAAELEAAAAQAAKEASDIPNLREQECKVMRTACAARSLKEKEIRSDGHCLYAAIADQLIDTEIGLKPRTGIPLTNNNHESLELGYKIIRQVAANYISENPEDFVPFLDEPIEEYTRAIRDTGEWGGHLELLALARAYGVNINVLQGDGKVETIECGSDKATSPLWLAYYRHYFGLGEHYNSLRRAVSPE